MNVKINDNVLVIAGKDKGKQGKVLATSPKTNKITVEGIRIQKKHEKARKANETSKIVQEPGPIDASNVMVVCSSCGKAVRVKHTKVAGKNVRVCAKCGAVLDKAYTKKVKAAAAEEAAPKKRTRKRVQKVEEAEEVKAPAVTEEAPKKRAKKTETAVEVEEAPKKRTRKTATKADDADSQE